MSGVPYNQVPVAIKPLHNDVILPVYATDGSAGMDIYAHSQHSLAPGESCKVSTGWAIAVPEGFELRIQIRSGIAFKQNLIVTNAPGCVDSDYRDEVGILITNLSKGYKHIKKGDRIAHGIISPVMRAKLQVVNDLGTTKRSGGFGSTGSQILTPAPTIMPNTETDKDQTAASSANVDTPSTIDQYRALLCKMMIEHPKLTNDLLNHLCIINNYAKQDDSVKPSLSETVAQLEPFVASNEVNIDEAKVSELLNPAIESKPIEFDEIQYPDTERAEEVVDEKVEEKLDDDTAADIDADDAYAAFEPVAIEQLAVFRSKSADNEAAYKLIVENSKYPKDVVDRSLIKLLANSLAVADSCPEPMKAIDVISETLNSLLEKE